MYVIVIPDWREITKKSIPISLTLLYILSFFLPATAISDPKKLETVVVNYLEIIKENPIGYAVGIVLALILLILYKNKNAAIVLYTALLTSYLWLTLPDAFYLFVAFPKVYGYYITLVLGGLAILTLGVYIKNYHKSI